MQPPYIGWLGFWEGVLMSDVLVLYDHVQFEPKSWQTRNKIVGGSGFGWQWLTVPVITAGRRFQAIKDVEIAHDLWAPKHWRTLEQCYAHAPYRDWLEPFGDIYDGPPQMLVDLNLAIIGAVMDALQVSVPVVRSSTLGPLPAGRESAIVAIVRSVGCDTLYDAAGAQALLDPKPFEDAGITLEFQKYQPVPYRQQREPFISHLSVLDALANLGPRTKDVILAGAQR